MTEITEDADDDRKPAARRAATSVTFGRSLTFLSSVAPFLRGDPRRPDSWPYNNRNIREL
jgi:hypothetical protein